MHNILNKSVLPKILTALRKRKSKGRYNTNLADSKEFLGTSKSTLRSSRATATEDGEENYELIIERVKRVEKKYKSILFASVELGSLPVTIPVNVAIGLAKNKKRCLLIDLDLRRDAVAKVFELDSNQNGLSPKAVRTEFENLWAWPGHNFTQLKQMNIKAIAEKAQDRFDFILINAPSLVSSPDRQQIVSAAQAAFICTKDASEATELAELIKPSNCMVIGHIQIPQPNLQ